MNGEQCESMPRDGRVTPSPSEQPCGDRDDGGVQSCVREVIAERPIAPERRIDAEGERRQGPVVTGVAAVVPVVPIENGGPREVALDDRIPKQDLAVVEAESGEEQ